MARKTLKDTVIFLLKLMMVTHTCAAYEEVQYGSRCYDSIIYLGINDKSALNFSLGQKSSEWPANFECNFRVDGGPGHGVIAVIQKMKLRRKAEGCLDYVEFQTKNTKMALPYLYALKRNKKQFCGERNISQMVALPGESVISLPDNVYIAEGKDLFVKVVINWKSLEPEESLDLHIVFTAAKRSYSVIEEHQFSHGGREREDFECGNHTYIWKGFVKDGLVNCPYKNCSDEEGCEVVNVKYSSGTGTTFIICAVASMLCVLGMFSFCLYICRRCKVLCWSGHSRPRASADASSHMSPDLGETVQPSAPPLISLNDKDLPPSYDSLFPARNPSVRSAVGQGSQKNCRDTREKFQRSRNSSISAGICTFVSEDRSMKFQRGVPDDCQDVVESPEASCPETESRRRGRSTRWYKRAWNPRWNHGHNSGSSHRPRQNWNWKWRPGQTDGRGQTALRGRGTNWRGPSSNRHTVQYHGVGRGVTGGRFRGGIASRRGQVYHGLGRGQGLTLAVGGGQGLGGALGRARPQNPPKRGKRRK